MRPNPDLDPRPSESGPERPGNPLPEETRPSESKFVVDRAWLYAPDFPVA
jgi:hypothetical protein